MNCFRALAAKWIVTCFSIFILSPVDADILDQSYDAVLDAPFFNSGTALTATQSLTQTFTVGVDGWLTQIDAQVAFTAPFPSTGLELNLLTLDEGFPLFESLGEAEVPIEVIPPRFPIMPGNFVSFDVSSLGIFVNEGDQLAFEITHATDTGSFTWFTGGAEGYSGGSSFFRNPPSTTFALVGGKTDYGFQTFVQPVPEPTCLFPLVTIGCLFVRRRVR